MKKIIMLFFVFGIAFNLTAQKRINFDTLTVDQLNRYKDKAIAMRNTGRALTLSGVGVFATGFVIGIIMMNTPAPDNSHNDMNGLLGGFYVICLGGLVGIPCTAVGIPLWTVGSRRKAKAELTLQKFNIASENSMVIGLGVTLRF
jgi:hypothetical protein